MLDDNDNVLKFLKIQLSDMHLGTPGSRATDLFHFLKYTRSESLYLVSDVIDGWQLKKRFYWPQEHNDVIQKLLRKARHGTRVIYIPGNHDEATRHFLGHNLGEVAISEDEIHETANGKRLWVVYGDLFENVTQHALWLAYLGDHAYAPLLKLSRVVNFVRSMFNMPY